MDAALQRRVQRYGWDRAAEYYEAYWAGQLRSVQRRLIELAALKPGERVLDVACGTGLVTFEAAAAVGPGGEVVGTDLSEKMVGAAAERAPGNVRVVRMDAEQLDLPDQSFDVALSSLGLMYIPDTIRAIAEMKRVLKPGGRAVVAVWGARNRCGWAEVFPIVDARVTSEVCPLFFRLGMSDALAHELRSGGFTAATVERMPVVLRYETADDACGAAFDGGPVALAYARFAPDVREAVHAEYLASIETYRDGTGYNVPGEFVLAVAT